MTTASAIGETLVSQGRERLEQLKISFWAVRPIGRFLTDHHRASCFYSVICQLRSAKRELSAAERLSGMDDHGAEFLARRAMRHICRAERAWAGFLIMAASGTRHAG